MAFIDEEKYVDALELYNLNKGDIMIYLETTTNNYEFHRDIVKPLLYKTMKTEDARDEYINILELDLAMTELVISLSDGNNIPIHYEDLLGEFSIAHLFQNNLNKAIELRNKQVEFIKEQGGANSKYYAVSLQFLSGMYYDIEKTEEAIGLMQKAKQIFEQHKDTESVNYCNKKLNEWKK